MLLNNNAFFNIIIKLNIYCNGEFMFKQKLFFLALFIVFVSICGFIDTKAKELPLLGKIIYLDAGHGGIG